MRPSLCRLLALILLPASGAALGAAPDDLSPMLRERLDEHPQLPSLCAVVVVGGEVRGAGAAGVRKRGDETPVLVDDKFHIGSCTKSMTATLAAALVEDGEIGWDATLGESLRELRPSEGFAKATLAQMLTNTGGFPGEPPADAWGAAWRARGSLTEQRRRFVGAVTKEDPAYPPGSGHAYSNQGFAAAGLMLEDAAGKSWEDLLRERLFKPLGMTSAGFGAPAGAAAKPDQPWGHDADGRPVPPGPRADNPAAIAPAGAVHCSLPDLARYAIFHLRGQPAPVLKSDASMKRLHTPVSNDYAMGWLVTERPWAHGVALTHMGSNTMFTTVIWIAPGRGFAAIVATNIGSSVAAGACDQVVGDLIGRYLE